MLRRSGAFCYPGFKALRALVLAFSVGSAVAGPLHWNSSALEREIPLEVKEPASSASAVGVVFYFKNLAAGRVGTESDDAILADFSRDGLLCVEVDYANDPRSTARRLTQDLARLRADVSSRRILGDRRIDPAHVYIVPAGCRIARDVVFYRNESRTWAMDIIYPSRPKTPTPVVLEFSCDNENRMGNNSLVACSDTLLDGLATEGFAVAMADHPVPAPYKGLDPMPDSAWKIKAAVRTLRAQREQLGLSGKIGAAGFSRGSGMALMLVTTEGVDEFENHGEHVGESSSVQAAVVLSGRFTYLDLLPNDKMISRYTAAWGERESHLDVWRKHGALDYLQSTPKIPLFLSINASEGVEAQHQMKALRRRLAELGADETFIMERQPRGHKVPLDPVVLQAMTDYLKTQLR